MALVGTRLVNGRHKLPRLLCRPVQSCGPGSCAGPRGRAMGTAPTWLVEGRERGTPGPWAGAAGWGEQAAGGLPCEKAWNVSSGPSPAP